MKDTIHIFFNCGRDGHEKAVEIAHSINCADGIEGDAHSFLAGGFSYDFDINDPRLMRLRAILAEKGKQWVERWDRTYSPADLNNSIMLRLGCRGRSFDAGGVERGTLYDLSAACENCGTGAVQTSGLMVPVSALPRKRSLCESHRGECLISSSVAAELRRINVTGAELRPVVNYLSNESLEWFQIVPTFTMPKMSPLTKGVMRDTKDIFTGEESPNWGCTLCCRDMFAESMLNPTEIIYDRSTTDPTQLPDIVATWECFGRSVLHDDPKRSLSRGFAQPLILVKRRVYEIFRTLKIREAWFQPIAFV